MQYLPDGEANIYTFHCPRKEPDRQASAPEGDKVNNIQGKILVYPVSLCLAHQCERWQQTFTT